MTAALEALHWRGLGRSWGTGEAGGLALKLYRSRVHVGGFLKELVKITGGFSIPKARTPPVSNIIDLEEYLLN